MSQFIRIRISQGSSSGPYTIYYNQVTTGTANVAQIYGTTTSYDFATSVSFSQLTGSPNYLIIVVPDTAYQIILVDNVNPCPPIIQLIPVPTPTPTVTPTPTPTSPPGGAFTLQWSILPSVLGNIYFDKDPLFIPDDDYAYAILIFGDGFSSIKRRPLETVTNNGIVSSRNIVALNMTTFPRNVGFLTQFLVGINQPNPINCTIRIFKNDIYTGIETILTVNNTSSTYPNTINVSFGNGLSIQDNDVFKIEIS